MRPWIAVAYSAPVAAATAVFIIYPIGQGSFSDGMPLGKGFASRSHKRTLLSCLKGETPLFPNSSEEGNEENSLLSFANMLIPFDSSQEKHQTAGVYLIFNRKTNQGYIGQTNSLPSCFRRHRQDLRNGKHENLKRLENWRLFCESMDFLNNFYSTVYGKRVCTKKFRVFFMT